MALLDVRFGGITSFQQASLNDSITNLELSFTMDIASQMTIAISDPELYLNSRNFFQIRRPVTYGGTTFEISAVQIGQGQGNVAQVELECRARPIQLLKRDKSPESYGATSPTNFARISAARYGMSFFGQETAELLNITKTASVDTDESSFDVLKRLAGESQFVVFESLNVLYFASQQYLLNKLNVVQFNYPSRESDPFQLLGLPNFRSSDDDPMQAEFQAIMMRQNATQLRPGMTVQMNGVNNFTYRYLITEVSFEEGKDTPVSVSGRTPEKIIPKDPATTV
jgi:hypothetical protein